MVVFGFVTPMTSSFAMTQSEGGGGGAESVPKVDSQSSEESSRQAIYQPLLSYLHEKFNLYLAELSSEYTKQQESIATQSSQKALQELNHLRSLLEQDQKEKNEILEQKRSFLNQKIAQLNGLFASLAEKQKELEKARTLMVQAQSNTLQIPALQSRVDEHLKFINQEMKNFGKESNEASRIAQDLNKLIQDINEGKGDIPIKIVKIQEETNSYLRQLKEEVETKINAHNDRIQNFKNWVDAEVRAIQHLEASLKNLQDTVNARLEPVNSAARKFND